MAVLTSGALAVAKPDAGPRASDAQSSLEATLRPGRGGSLGIGFF
ncbi:MAG TPA: hypothetical protein VEQ58_07095 [Polyangiaceae bacterium]|nr:hypothetical protein [Polyangiaceae bacterium]